jgi:hypothetical protein
MIKSSARIVKMPTIRLVTWLFDGFEIDCLDISQTFTRELPIISGTVIPYFLLSLSIYKSMKKKSFKVYHHFPVMIFIAAFSFVFVPLAGQVVSPDTLGTSMQTEIQKSLERDRFNAGCWWYGWLGAYSAATVAQGAVYLTSDTKPLRQDMALGSMTTMLGALGQIVTPLVKNEKNINQYNQESLFSDLAQRETAGRSWKVHAVTGVVNIGSGLITWLGFKRTFRDGVENFLLNTAITEAQIWTQPIRAAKDYENYYGKSPDSATSLKRNRAEWFFCVYPGGASLNIRF